MGLLLPSAASNSSRTRLLAAVFVLAVFVACLAACRKTSSETAPIRKYSVRGEVVRLDAGRRIATIKHDKIEGWMEAMTMDFPVRDDRDLKTLSRERVIVATVYVQDLEFWIADVSPAP